MHSRVSWWRTNRLNWVILKCLSHTNTFICLQLEQTVSRQIQRSFDGVGGDEMRIEIERETSSAQLHWHRPLAGLLVCAPAWQVSKPKLQDRSRSGPEPEHTGLVWLLAPPPFLAVVNKELVRAKDEEKRLLSKSMFPNCSFTPFSFLCQL